MIGIIGDTHFGAGYNMGKIDPATQLNNRLLDFSNTFNKIIDDHVARGVKIIILTGDIFETRHPTSSQHKVFSKCIQRAVDLGLEILINVGNHDQQRHIDTTTVDIYNSLRIDGVKVYQEIGVYSISDKLHLVIMPYRDRRMLGGLSNKDAIEILRQKFQDKISNLSGQIVVVGHFMLEKGMEHIDPDLFSMNELILPLDLFDGSDIVVMGHIHRHEMLTKDKPKFIYSGSMERVSFGEKDHNKVSIVINPEDLDDIEIIPTKVRDLHELNFDYIDEKPFKQNINNKIIEDIDIYAKDNKLPNSICKIMLRIKESDLYYINQSEIKNYMLNKNIRSCTGVHVSSINNRQLRNSAINETLSGKKAIASFIDGLQDSDQTKKRLLKYAEQVIEEVEGRK